MMSSFLPICHCKRLGSLCYFYKPVGFRRAMLTNPFQSRPCSMLAALDGKSLASARQNKFFLDVKWTDNTSSHYPFIYLRDSCPCPDCLHPPSQQRLFDFVSQKVSLDIVPSEVKLSDDGEAVIVLWPDGHKSTFDSLWLNDHQLRFGDGHLSAQHLKLPNQYLWQVKDAHAFLNQVRFTLPDLLSKPQLVYKWLLQLHKYGMTFVTSAGTDEGMLKKFTEHIASLKRTSYGETYFVESIPQANNLAYASSALSLHVDLPYLQHEPGVVFLHCLRQSPDGGHTYFSDGFSAALHMREHEPELFKVLCDVDVTWQSKGFDRHSGMDYHHEAKHPVFELNRRNELVQVFYGFFNRSSRLEIEPMEARLFYKAFHHFGQLCSQSDRQLRYRVAPGEIAVFDNRRIVHGRGELSTEGAVRRLEGGYWVWDDVLSRLHVLHRQLSGQ